MEDTTPSLSLPAFLPHLNLLVFSDYLGIVLNKPIIVYQLAPLLLHPS